MIPDVDGLVATAVSIAALGGYKVALTLRGRAALRSAIAFQEERQEKDAYALLRGVTALQPILSGDPELEATLRQNVVALPETVRFVWLIDREDAEGRRIAEGLLAESAGSAGPGDRIRIVLCPPTAPTENPKSAKLERGLALVATDYVAVVDDDTIVPPASFAAALGELDEFHLATGLPVYREGKTFWGRLVADFVNDNACTTYLPLTRSHGPLSINGMFYVTRTETLRSLGGFAVVRDRLCDDYAIARLYLDSGRSLRQTIEPQLVGTTVASAREYLRLLHRWNRFALALVRDRSPQVQALLFTTLALPPILLWISLAGAGVAAAQSWTVWFWLPPVVVLGAIYAAAVVRSRVHRRIVPALPRGSVWRSFLVELLQPVHLVHALARPTIVWRARRIRTSSDGRFHELGAPR